jgi:hypothetical protein
LIIEIFSDYLLTYFERLEYPKIQLAEFQFLPYYKHHALNIDMMLYAGLRVSDVEQLKIVDISVNVDVTITVRDGKQGKYGT